MSFALGMAAGAFIATVVWVAFMAPKHWDWFQQNKTLTEQLRIRTEEREHYKAIASPSKWGSVAQREAGIKPKQQVVYPDAEAGDVHFRFDDIKDGGDR